MLLLECSQLSRAPVAVTQPSPKVDSVCIDAWADSAFAFGAESAKEVKMVVTLLL